MTTKTLSIPHPGDVWMFHPWGWLMIILKGGNQESGFPYRRVTREGGTGQGFLGVNTIQEGLAKRVETINGQPHCLAEP